MNTGTRTVRWLGAAFVARSFELFVGVWLIVTGGRGVAASEGSDHDPAPLASAPHHLGGALS